MMHGMMDGTMPGWMAGGMWVALLLWALLLVALIALAVAGTVKLLRGAAPPRERLAREELDLRYARGQLDRDEYLQRRADLGDQR